MRVKSVWELVKKDLIVYKKTAIIFSLLGANYFSLKSEGFNSMVLCVSALSLLLMFLITSLIEESKNNGAELLLTTTYTRTDLVVARYFLMLTILSFQVILNIITMIFIAEGSFAFVNSINWYMVSIGWFLSLAIFVPLTFVLTYKTLPIPFVLINILIMMIGGIFYKLKQEGIDVESYNGIYLFLALIVSIILLVVSMMISNKIFSKKDL